MLWLERGSGLSSLTKSRTCCTCSLLVTWQYVCGSVPENSRVIVCVSNTILAMEKNY